MHYFSRVECTYAFRVINSNI